MPDSEDAAGINGSPRIFDVLDALRYPVTVQDARYTIRFMNARLRRRHGDGDGGRCHRVYMGRAEPCPGCPAPAIIAGDIEEASYTIEDAAGRLFECTAGAIRLPDGSKGVVETLADVTARRKAAGVIHEFARSMRGAVAEKDAALRRSEEMFQALFEHAGDAILTAEAGGDIISANRSAERLTGYSGEEIGALRATALFAPGDFERIREELLRSPPGAGLIRRAEIVRRDGTPVPVDVNANRLTHGGREIIIAICRDMREALMINRRAQLLASAVENTSSSVILTDLDHRIIYVNPATLRMLGYREEEMLGRPTADFYEGTPGNPPSLADQIRREARDGVWEGEIFNRTRTGEVFPAALCMCIVRNERGGIIGYAGIADDISRRRRMEEELVRREKMSLLGELVAGIAHELNNPLTGVLGYAEIIRNSPCPEEVRDDAGRIHEEASRCHALVRNLLTFGRRPPPVLEPADLNAAVEAALHSAGKELAADGIEVDVRLDRGLPHAPIDIQQMQHVFLNIITNARHALAGRRGRRRIAVTSRVRDGRIEAAVSNNGPPIRAESLEKIFTPFFSTKEFGHGTGLGLSIARGIVEDHGGEIRVESVRKTVFTVSLPLPSPP
ncbi:MAG: PAS domain S-box protein [bacterium]|nr:PAS domain S-box protein [bacterium]